MTLYYGFVKQECLIQRPQSDSITTCRLLVGNKLDRNSHHNLGIKFVVMLVDVPYPCLLLAFSGVNLVSMIFRPGYWINTAHTLMKHAKYCVETKEIWIRWSFSWFPNVRIIHVSSVIHASTRIMLRAENRNDPPFHSYLH